MSPAPRVAISSDFLSAFAEIPRKKQGKVMDFVSRFRSRPDSPGINYEKIKDARDGNLRSVRIDDTYRGIVLHPPSGNLYLLLWVDHHDDAYAWARNRKCSVHPETGSLQVFEVRETVREAEQASAPEAVPPLFEGVKEKYLLRMGVPSELLPAVREIRSEEELNRLVQSLPREAGDALSLLHLGFPPEEILQDLELKKPDAKVDTEDFAKALQTDESRSRFFVAEDDLELQAILQAPLEKWRVFLHPTQRKIVEKDWNGPVRVLGGAGTGKTVAAVHRARWLVQSVLKDPNERVLFTTFTVNLAEDIRSNLAKLCSDETMKRIEVINLDRWVSQFLKAREYEMKLLFDDEKRRDFWGRAMAYKPVDIDLPESFWIEEWEKVIQPQEITGEKEYFQADRKGRGGSLDRKQRKAVWPVFEEYRALLSENGYSELDDAMRDARKLLESSEEKLPYRSIVVDEAQDLGPLAFKLIRRMVPEGNNDIFIVGDAHQRIYKRRTVLSKCGIEVRGRSRKLRINYRTTEETKDWAVALLEGRDFDDLDGGRDSQKGYRSLLRGQPPRLEGFPSFEDEAGFLAAYLNELLASGEPLRNICLVARTNSLLEQYRSALNAKGIGTVVVRADAPEDGRQDGVRLATMHRVKGLEFDRMIIAGAGALPHRSVRETDDPAEAGERDTMERSLAYVAATRARTHLLVTWNGETPEMLGKG